MTLNTSQEPIFDPPCQTLECLTSDHIRYELEVRNLNSDDQSPEALSILSNKMKGEKEPWKCPTTRKKAIEIHICRKGIEEAEASVETNPTEISSGNTNLLLHFIWRLQRVRDFGTNTRTQTASGEMDNLMKRAKKCYLKMVELISELHQISIRSSKMLRSPSAESTHMNGALNTSDQTPESELEKQSQSSTDPQTASIQSNPVSVNNTNTGSEKTNDSVTNQNNESKTLTPNALSGETTSIFDATTIRNDNQFLQLSQSHVDPNVSQLVRNINSAVDHHVQPVPRYTQLVYTEEQVSPIRNPIVTTANTMNPNNTNSVIPTHTPSMHMMVTSGSMMSTQANNAPVLSLTGAISRNHYNAQAVIQQNRNSNGQPVTTSANQGQIHIGNPGGSVNNQNHIVMSKPNGNLNVQSNTVNDTGFGQTHQPIPFNGNVNMQSNTVNNTENGQMQSQIPFNSQIMSTNSQGMIVHLSHDNLNNQNSVSIQSNVNNMKPVEKLVHGFLKAGFAKCCSIYTTCYSAGYFRPV